MFVPITKLTTAFAVSFCIQASVAWGAGNLEQSNIVTLPEKLDKSCRSGRAKLFDECTSQLTIFSLARERAALENKVLLVSYGAEWCIWCHVFAAYIEGKTHTFTYTYGSPDEPDARETSTLRERAKTNPAPVAAALNNFVSKAFVVVHIDAQFAPDSDAVLQGTGASDHYRNSIPFVFAVDRDGKYAGSIIDEEVQVRRDGMIDWYRGYDRAKLLNVLKAIYAKGASKQ